MLSIFLSSHWCWVCKLMSKLHLMLNLQAWCPSSTWCYVHNGSHLCPLHCVHTCSSHPLLCRFEALLSFFFTFHIIIFMLLCGNVCFAVWRTITWKCNGFPKRFLKKGGGSFNQVLQKGQNALHCNLKLKLNYNLKSNLHCSLKSSHFNKKFLHCSMKLMMMVEQGRFVKKHVRQNVVWKKKNCRCNSWWTH